MFECIENFLRRLSIYTEIDVVTPMMTEIIVKIMVELISVLGLATKQINRGRFSMSALANDHLLLILWQRITPKKFWEKRTSNQC